MAEGPLSNEATVTAEAVETVGVYPYGGRLPYGEGRHYGDHPQVLVPSTTSRGIPFLDGNDRSQVVLVSRDGRAGGTPEFRFWLAQPPQWGELLGAVQPATTILRTYAHNERDDPTVGALQFAAVAVAAGQEATITGVRVEFAPRPAAIGNNDGGVPATEPVGFDVYVEGFGLPRQLLDTSIDPRVTGIQRSDTISFERTAAEVSSDAWPDVWTAHFPCRLSPVRDFQAHIVNIRHCQIRAVEIFGTQQPSRLG